jgi:hypothetical protein
MLREAGGYILAPIPRGLDWPDEEWSRRIGHDNVRQIGQLALIWPWGWRYK